MDGTRELRELNEMLRIGLRTVREIANLRPKDYDRLMDIAERSEVMANDLDEIITGALDQAPRV